MGGYADTLLRQQGTARDFRDGAATKSRFEFGQRWSHRPRIFTAGR